MGVREQESSSEYHWTSESRGSISENFVDSLACRCIVRTAKLNLLAKVVHFPRRLFTLQSYEGDQNGNQESCNEKGTSLNYSQV